MLAGRRPFEGAAASDVMAAVLTKEPVPLAESAPEVPAPCGGSYGDVWRRNPGDVSNLRATSPLALDELKTSSASSPSVKVSAEARIAAPSLSSLAKDGVLGPLRRRRQLTPAHQAFAVVVFLLWKQPEEKLARSFRLT